MTLIKNLEDWLRKILWHKSDTPETLEQKVYLVKNGMIASFIISIVFMLFPVFKLYKLFLLVSPTLGVIIIMLVLAFTIKRGIKWFFYFYYGGYIITCSLIVLALGGLPNSLGVWGGAFIVFMHSLAIKHKRVLIINSFIYFSALVIIALSYPGLKTPEQWNPRFNNIAFTVNEFWMCLFLVKAFYDSIVARTNEAKQKAEHLQKLDMLKSKLYANITHEFRTPLTLIRGNVEEISEYLDGETTEKAKNIIQSSDKILFLVNQMLNLSKIEEGRVPMHYIQCDLVNFVRFVVGSVQGFADLRKIRLHYKPGLSQLLMDIEPEKLEESLANLLSNAIKYTPEGGDVFVSLRLLNQGNSNEKQVEISVRDTGIGIPEEDLEKIFIRFYRVEDNRFPYREGTGIGLTLVSEYMKLMKGSVKVKSTPGKGSEFAITVPVTHNAEIEEVVAGNGNPLQTKENSNLKYTPGDGIFNQPRLLIIEDNPGLSDYLIRLLGNEYQVLAAENGIRGIEQAIENIPDIILSDVMMPGKDGFQVCRELKNDFRTSHIPIVLLTARADTESRITGMERGADAYLTKPFNKRELQICLHNILVQRETLRLKFSNVFEKKMDEQEHGLNGKFLEKVIGHLEKNYKNDWYGIHHLYTDLKISRVQLHRKLTALTGQPASNFIRSFRLQKAKKLLLETNKHVSDIAFDVGITDVSYFSQLFLKEHGIAPTELRKSFA
jgi:signal transduction histidine kinase/DNA-binding response OmpR family regulator